jgi:hypothetical protein
MVFYGNLNKQNRINNTLNSSISQMKNFEHVEVIPRQKYNAYLFSCPKSQSIQFISLFVLCMQ